LFSHSIIYLFLFLTLSYFTLKNKKYPQNCYAADSTKAGCAWNDSPTLFFGISTELREANNGGWSWGRAVGFLLLVRYNKMSPVRG
jgi:hypothetical protein